MDRYLGLKILIFPSGQVFSWNFSQTPSVVALNLIETFWVLKVKTQKFKCDILVYFELNDSSFNQLTHDGSVACAIQIQWLRFGGPRNCGFCNSAYAKGSHSLLPFQKVILHVVECVCVFRFGVFYTRSWFQ